MTVNTPQQSSQSTHSQVSAPRQARSGWTPGRIVALVVGALLLLGATGMLAGGNVVLALDDEWRQDGYLTSNKIPLATGGHAVAAAGIEVDAYTPESLLGTARLRAGSTDGRTPVFVGVARTDEAAAYLAGVRHATVTEIGEHTEYTDHAGGAPVVRPADAGIWMAQATGSGTQVLTWPFGDGPWTVVVMNADGSAGIDVSTDVGATLPVIPRIGRWLLVGSLFVALVGIVMIAAAANAIPARRRTHLQADRKGVDS